MYTITLFYVPEFQFVKVFAFAVRQVQDILVAVLQFIGMSGLPGFARCPARGNRLHRSDHWKCSDSGRSIIG